MKALVYLAAPLFSESERRFNLQVRELLEGHAFRVYLPQEQGEGAERGSTPDRSTFLRHVEVLRASDAVLAICDGPDTDSGTSWEMGYAFALGKPVVALKTDTRRAAHGRRLNLMLEESSRVAGGLEELVPLLGSVLRNQQSG